MRNIPLLFAGFILLFVAPHCYASSSITFSEPNSNSVVKLEANGTVNYDLTYTDSSYNYPSRYYSRYLYKGDEQINNHLCSTGKSHGIEEIKYGCYTYGLEEGDDYRMKIGVIENGEQEDYFSDYFSIKGSYDTRLDVKVLEEKINTGDRVNVEFRSESCNISTIQPWISFVNKNEENNYLLTHIMDSSFNSGSVKTYAGVTDYGGEFLRNYFATNKDNFSFIIPKTVGLTVNSYNINGSIMTSTMVLFYVSEKGAYTTKQTDQNISYLLGSGDYKVFIKGEGRTTTNEKCVVFGISNKFTITDIEVKQSSSHYPDINSFTEIVKNLSSQVSTVENTVNTNITNNFSANLNKDAIVIKNRAMYIRLKGKIVLKVEDSGKAYYVNPETESAHYLGRPDDAFQVMREQGVGITNKDLYKIPVGISEGGGDSDSDGLSDNLENAMGLDSNKSDTDGDGYGDRDELFNGYNPWGIGKQNIDNSFSGNQEGKILLQVENNGEAWYVNPGDGRRYFLGRPVDAFDVMRNLGLGISNNDFNSMIQ